MGQDASGAEAIRLSAWLAPQDSTVQFVAAGQKVDDGDWPAAMIGFRKAYSLSNEILPDIINAFIDNFHRPAKLLDIVGTDINSLRLVAQTLRDREHALAATTQPSPDASSAVLSSQPAPAADVRAVEAQMDDYEQVAKQATETIEREIANAAQASDASASTLSEMARQLVAKHQLSQSLPYFQRALIQNYGDGATRFAYAQALIDLHNDREAYQQLQIFLRRYPEDGTAKQLAEAILVRRAMNDAGGEKVPTPQY